MSIDTLGPLLFAAVRAYGENLPRTKQSAAGILGPSSIGWCRQKALLMMRGIPESDSVGIWQATVGTAVHVPLEKAKEEYFPGWVTNTRLTATLPSGYELSGTPDAVIPELNAVEDDKTVDGYERIHKYGQSQSNIYQLVIYALACIQAGLLDPTQPLYLVNVYWDRSGRNEEPLVLHTLYTDDLVQEVDDWITDVVQANLRGEDANRDIEPVICKRTCSHFTTCRGGLPVHDEKKVITAPELVGAAELVFDGRALQARGKQMEAEGKEELVDVDGVTDRFQIRHVIVNRKSGSYPRLDVIER